MAQLRSPVSRMDVDELVSWVRSLADNSSVDISPAGARRLARKIKRKGITGAQLCGKSHSAVQQLFGAAWDPHLVQALYDAINEEQLASRLSAIAFDDDAKAEDIPKRFNVHVRFGGRRTAIVQVDQSWTLHEFKLIHACGCRVVVMGNMLSDHDEYRTLAELGFRPDISVHVVPVLMGGGGGGDDNAVENVESDEKQSEMLSEINRELAAIKRGRVESRAKVYRLAKRTYRAQGKPVVVDADDTLRKIKNNASNYRNVALPVTLAVDKDFSSWDEGAFKRDFARRFSIPEECIEVVSVRAGSVIIDTKLHTHTSGNKLVIPIECIAENISTDAAKKALVEFGIFAMEFGEPVAGFDCLKQRVIMNPQWNRVYGQGHTHWTGPLNDGKSRGGEPYYCPNGWQRFAVQFEETAYDFANVYDQWPIAYHGTKFNVHMMITLSGLKASGGGGGHAVHGEGVYLSPSIKYVSHPRYCEPYKMDLSKAQQASWTAQQLDLFSKYNGKWIQCAFACRVKPGCFRKCRQTMQLGNDGTFDNIDKRTIEWIIPGKQGELIGPDKILIYGFMIKASDSKPTGY